MFWQNTKSVLASLVILAFLGTGVGLFTTLGIPGNSAAAFLGDEGEGEGKRLYGILEKIDVEKGTLVLVTQRDGEGRREHVLSLAGKDIKITGLRERKISLKDLARGQRLTVFLSPASDVTAIRIGRGRVVSRERGDGDGDRRERRRVIGFLKSVNEKERSITIRQRSDAGNKEKTLILGKEAQIRVREGSNKLSDLQPEMILGLYLSEDGKTIREVRLIRGVRRQPQPRRPEGFFRGYVHGVGENTIIIGGRNERGDRMTLTVAKNAVVSLKGKDAAKLTDIKKGTLVFLLMSPNKREVIAVREVEGSLGGDRERFENEGDAPRRDRERDEREGGEGGSPRRDPERDEREGGENGAPRDRE